MSSRLPYEEIDKQFNDLPLPDQEASWQKMEQMLDSDRDNDRILPPIFLKTCAGWALLLMFISAGIWLVVQPRNQRNENSTTKQTEKALPQTNKENQTPIGDQISNKSQNVSKHSSGENPEIIRQAQRKTGPEKLISNQKYSNKVSIASVNKTNKINKGTAGTKKQDEKVLPGTITIFSNQKLRVKEINNPIKITDKKEWPTGNDSVIRTPIVSEQSKTSEKKVVQHNKNDFYFSVGIGEQQQIPIAGQTSVPYSSYGREGSFSDYIPSVYVRLHKKENWFVQAEFRYGAAQSLKEFSYSQQTKLDPSGSNVTTTTLRLKKTYYHQLPLSFNYYVYPRLSVGIGGIYSRFYRAITEQETKTRNLQTQTEIVNKQIIPVKNFTDSFLYKTQVHLLLQADYEWKRLSFGLRYTKDMQPFIKYTKPDGAIDEEKNQTLQFILRFRLWQSGKL